MRIMDKFCEDCVHNEVCQYYAIPPHKDRCNDKDTLDDLRPQGEWKTITQQGRSGDGRTFDYEIVVCSECGEAPDALGEKFCPNCGADMRKGDDSYDK